MVRFIFLSLVILLTADLYSQEKYKIVSIAFYNVENLFDIENDPNTNDDEYTPTGPTLWTLERYNKKLDNIAEVISKVGIDKAPKGLSVIGMCEIENKKVLEDLVAREAIAKRNYQYIHYDSPERRGVDVALLYNPSHFKVISSRAVPLKVADKPDFFTRDQLVVSGILDGETVHFIVNHWPSRRGGEKRSAPLRVEAAKQVRFLVDSILATDSTAKVIVMGDLNDDPVNKSITKHLGAKCDSTGMKNRDLFNPMCDLLKKGIGSLAYRDSWNLFDQIIVTGNVVKGDKKSYKFYTAKIFNEPFLMQKEGAFKGYPFRTYVGTTFQGGYSDHFPAYMYLVKEKN